MNIQRAGDLSNGFLQAPRKFEMRVAPFQTVAGMIFVGEPDFPLAVRIAQNMLAVAVVSRVSVACCFKCFFHGINIQGKRPLSNEIERKEKESFPLQWCAPNAILSHRRFSHRKQQPNNSKGTYPR